MPATEVFEAASKALIARTDSLADVGTPFPKVRGEREHFPYARDLLDWVLSQKGVTDTDLANQCFHALRLLGIVYAVPEADSWIQAFLTWEDQKEEM